MAGDGKKEAMSSGLTAATGVSVMSITLQLKNYRKPSLQRAVVRIMLMCVFAPRAHETRELMIGYHYTPSLP